MPTRSFRLAPLAIVFLILAGCAAPPDIRQSYDSSSGQTTYEGASVTIVDQLSESNIASTASIEMNPSAECAGQGCRPDLATLIFSINGASKRTAFGSRTISFTADGETFRWEGSRQRRASTVSEAVQVFRKIEVDVQTLATIARADEVQGTVGTRAFQLDYEAREPLRKFVEMVTEGKAPAE